MKHENKQMNITLIKYNSASPDGAPVIPDSVDDLFDVIDDGNDSGDGGDPSNGGDPGNDDGNDGGAQTFDLSSITDEQKNTILTSTSGASFNEIGDILDNDGKVIIKSSELSDKLKELNIDLSSGSDDNDDTDDDIYDDAGNLIDANGNIVKSAEDIEKESKYVLKLNAFNEFKSNLGYDIKDEEGKVKFYEPSKEGQLAYVKDAIEIAKQGAIKDYTTNLDDDVRKFIEFKSLGGKTEDFFQVSEDYSQLALTEEDTENHKKVIVAYQKSKGISTEMASRLADYSISAGESFKDAQEALSILNAENQSSREAKLEQLRKAEVIQKQQRDAQLQELKKTIVIDGKIDDFTIPVADRQAFYNYIIGDGKNPAKIDLDLKQDPEKARKLQMIFDYHILFKKKGLNDLFKENVTTASIDAMLKRYQKSQQAKKGQGGSGAANPNKGNANSTPDDPNELFI